MINRVFLLLAILLLCACRADTIEDRRSGQVMLCHNGKKTLIVSNAASFAHLDHGDSAGPCANESP